MGTCRETVPMTVTSLTVMNTIIILMCALVKLVISQIPDEPHDISPAKLMTQQKNINEGGNLHMTCSTFGYKKLSSVYVYLCKDGLGISKMEQKQDQQDSFFTVYRVGLNDSGNYSCVFSKIDYPPSKVAMRGHNIIQIQVIANFLPANISVVGLSTVSEGEDIEFRCAVSDALQTLDNCQVIQSYLKKNESLLQVQAFHVAQMETTFIIKDAVARDSGHYSCVVLPSKCIQEQGKTEENLPGNNTVLVKVKGGFLLQLTVLCGVMNLLLLLVLCLWCIPRKQGESFSMEEEEGNQASVAADDMSYSDEWEDDGERLYANVDIPTPSPTRMDAVSVK